MSAKQTDTMEYVGDLKFWTRYGHPLGYHRGLAPKKKPPRSGAQGNIWGKGEVTWDDQI